MTTHIKKVVFSTLLTFACVGVALLFPEFVLRMKNASMKNYDIEMWRYAKELKTPSENPLLGHEHLKNQQATLQSVLLRTNEWGLRGGPVSQTPAPRRILALGSSITFGWGVKEEETMTSLLENKLKSAGEEVEFLNAGIGNYNSARYVERFLTRLEDLHPTDILVHYFLRDAETLEAGGGNWFLKNSQVAVTLWMALNQMKQKTGGLEEHYRKVYEPNAPGRVEMEKALARLARYAREKKIKLYLAMTPDVHDLINYPFASIHEEMKKVAEREGYEYVDLLPALRGIPSSEIWSLPNDPHPNALGHRKMAEALFPVMHNNPIVNRAISSK